MDRTGNKNNHSFMDNLVAVFKNVWLKRGVALLCWGYTAFLVWLDWVNLAYFMEYDNPTSLFVLYVFINVAALALMIYTRNQVITQINAMLLPPIWFASLILVFGNWYMILPPLCVILAAFFICKANETLKTVLGTIYLLMYVVGAAAYVTITLLMGKIPLNGVDLELRDPNYLVLAPDEDYRIVRYVDAPGSERRTASYYVEETKDDIEIPFAVGKKVLGSGWVLTTKYNGSSDNPVKWVKTTIDGEKVQALSVEGSVHENPYLVEDVTVTEEPEVTTKPKKTTATTAKKEPETVETTEIPSTKEN